MLVRKFESSSYVISVFSENDIVKFLGFAEISSELWFENIKCRATEIVVSILFTVKPKKVIKKLLIK